VEILDKSVMFRPIQAFGDHYCGRLTSARSRGSWTERGFWTELSCSTSIPAPAFNWFQGRAHTLSQVHNDGANRLDGQLDENNW